MLNPGDQSFQHSRDNEVPILAEGGDGGGHCGQAIGVEDAALRAHELGQALLKVQVDIYSRGITQR